MLTQSPEKTALASGATHIVEAESAEQALAQVHDKFGADARIVDAQRTLRGGIGGFFAREIVQLHVAPGKTKSRAELDAQVADILRRAGASAPASTVDTASTDNREDTQRHQRGPQVRSPVDRVLSGPQTAETSRDGRVDFNTFLQIELADEASTSDTPLSHDRGVTSTTSTPAPETHGPAPVNNVKPQPKSYDPQRTPSSHPETTNHPWSGTALVRLGLPRSFVDGLRVDSPADDVAWTMALAQALRPLCRPLPAGPSLLCGPLARRIGTTVGLPFHADTTAPDTATAQWVHAVAGGRSWRNVLMHEPMAISWTRREDLGDAIACAVEFGLVLGYGPAPRSIIRAQPVEVAMTIRGLLSKAGIT